MILNSFPEISEKFLLNQIIALIGAGIDLDIYPAHKPQGNDVHDLFDKYKIAEHVKYVDIPRSFKKRLPLAAIKFLGLFAVKPFAAFRALDSRKYRTVAKNSKLVFFGLKLIDERYDIVHCHFGVNGLIGAYLKDCGIAKSLVVTFHGSDINTYPSRHGFDVYKTLYQRANLVTVNTSFTGAKVRANGCDDSLIRVQPVGLIPSDYDSVTRDQIEKHSVLTVGRLVEKKGHEFFLRALPEILSQHPDTVWYIAGDGPLRNYLQSLSMELGVVDSVRFLGQCENDVVKRLYARVGIFVLPSVTASDGDMEGQGLVLQEAQYCRIPVISTLHNGIPDGVLDGKSGYLVPEKDTKALASRILELFANPELGKKMGECGHEYVLKNYNVNTLALTMKQWYMDLS